MTVSTLNASEARFIADFRAAEADAVTCYDYALPRIEDQDVSLRLAPIHAHHRAAQAEAEALLAEAGDDAEGEATSDWGTVAVHLKELASMLGDTALLATLAAAERSAVKLFRVALERDDLDDALQERIRDQYLPRQEENLRVLSSLIWTTRSPETV